MNTSLPYIEPQMPKCTESQYSKNVSYTQATAHEGFAWVRRHFDLMSNSLWADHEQSSRMRL